MFEVLAFVFCMGCILSFYASNKEDVDKVREDLEKLVDD